MTTITEKWARTAPAGPELDRVCAEWMGRRVKTERPAEIEWERCQHRDKFSTSWKAAGPLLKAMGAAIEPPNRSGMTTWLCYVWQSIGCGARADDPCLAISRACAVLVARGISREDLG